MAFPTSTGALRYIPRIFLSQKLFFPFWPLVFFVVVVAVVDDDDRGGAGGGGGRRVTLLLRIRCNRQISMEYVLRA